MKKILSKLLVFVMLFSIISSSMKIDVQAAIDTISNSINNYGEVVQSTNLDESKKSVCGVDNLGIDNLLDTSKGYSSYGIANYSSTINLSECNNMRPIVIYIKFPDDKTQYFTVDKINEIKKGLTANDFSVNTYLNLVSYGKCSIDPIFTYDKNSRIYTATHKANYYKKYQAGTNEEGFKTYNEEIARRDELFNGAIRECTKGIDFSNVDLDKNGDGKIDNIMFFTSESDNYSSILYAENWAIWNDQPQIVDKSGVAKKVYRYINIDKNSLEGWGRRVLTHEYSHNIGIPDMYQYPNNKTAIKDPCGSYTMLCDNSGYPTVHERIKYCNWLTYSCIPTISQEGTYSLKDVSNDPNSNTIAYKIEVPDSNEYFMVEYRNRDANIVENLIPESGILVYRVDPSKNGNGNEDPEIYVLRNDGQTADKGVLTGASGRKSVNLTLSSGEDTGYRIEYVSNNRADAKFKLVCNSGVKYSTIIQGKTDFEQLSQDGKLSGTEGQGKRIEGLKINTYAPDGDVTYRAYIHNKGWTEWVSSNKEIKSNGNDIENIQVKLNGSLANNYNVYYRTHNRYYGWLGWTSNGEIAGTSNYNSAIEGIQIRLIKKGTSINGITNDTNSAYKANPQKYTVTFKDYDGRVISTQKVSYGEDATAPMPPSSRTGYRFAGWSENNKNITKDTVIVAIYNINKYTVTFKDYDGKVLKTETVNYGSSATAPSNPTRSGYVFSYWNGNYKNVTSNQTVTAVYNRDLKITSIDINGGKPVVAGEEAYIKINTNCSSGLIYSINLHSIAGNIALLTRSNSNIVKWIPTEHYVGTHCALEIAVEDTLSQAYVSETSGFSVVNDTNNQTTIYYKGYDNAHIHYKIGNGEWTKGSGVSMSPNSDVNGYNYSITIDLGDADNLTACFNNGNGLWDSNNQNNYKFGTGYYTYSNGVITKISKPTKQLKIDSITSMLGSSYVSGKQNIFTVKSSNGKGEVQYQFEYKNKITGESGVLRSYTKYNTLSSYLSTPGQYTLTVRAKDEDGNTDIKTLDFTIEEHVSLKITSVTSSLGDTFQKGKTTQLTINTIGGKGSNYYALDVNGKSILDGATSNTVSWTPTEAGTYEIIAYAREEQDCYTTYKKTITVEDKVSNQTTIYYKGYDNAHIHYKIGNGEWTKGSGVSMSPNSDVNGYNYSITIDLGDADNLTACFNNGNGLWDSNNQNNYKFGTGYYTYSNGVITKIEKPSSELKINSITCSSGSTIKMGSTVDLTVNASGGEGPYTYYLYYSAYGSGRANYRLNGTSTNKTTFTPDYPRETTIYAEVVDSTGKRVTYSQTFNVKDNTSNQTTIYYKGYDNAHIHYKIGNGEWTKESGVEMEKTSEKPGYDYKITIDLGDADNLTVCFNNGNGLWDSNNGNNYVFGVGEYTYSNGNITKIN